MAGGAINISLLNWHSTTETEGFVHKYVLRVKLSQTSILGLYPHLNHQRNPVDSTV